MPVGTSVPTVADELSFTVVLGTAMRYDRVGAYSTQWSNWFFVEFFFVRVELQNQKF